MKKNKVSIIVPIYNAKKTLNRCVDSLISQTYTNIEIVLVNDGSSDNSLEIAKEYAKNNGNIILINQENSGAGIARNNGLINSTGDYVTFVDSDDKLNKDAIKNLITCINEKTDIVISGFKEIDDQGNVIIDMIPEENYWTEFKFTSTMFKLYKRKFLVKNDIKFANFNVFEDLYFCLSAYSKTNNIEICKKQDYIIYKNPDSITSNFSNRPLKDCIDVLNQINENINFEKYKKSSVEFFYLKTIILNIIVQLDGHDLNEINNMYLNDYMWLKKLNVRNKKKISFYWQKHETFFINFVVNIFNLFTKIRLNKFLIFILQKMKVFRVK